MDKGLFVPKKQRLVAMAVKDRDRPQGLYSKEHGGLYWTGPLTHESRMTPEGFHRLMSNTLISHGSEQDFQNIHRSWRCWGQKQAKRLGKGDDGAGVWSRMMWGKDHEASQDAATTTT